MVGIPAQCFGIRYILLGKCVNWNRISACPSFETTTQNDGDVVEPSTDASFIFKNVSLKVLCTMDAKKIILQS